MVWNHLEKKIIKCFLSYMNMAAILFNGVEPFEQTVNTPSKESSMRKLLKIDQVGFREHVLRLHNFIHVYSPGARADNPMGTKF